MKDRPERQPWQLHPKDFTKKHVYAKQDWRFQMFFEYLRISPSYQMALESTEDALLAHFNDIERAKSIWKTRTDFGNVHEYLFKEWWLEKGLPLFGIHTSKPRLHYVQRLSHLADDTNLLVDANRTLSEFIRGKFANEGKPDSALISIPLGQSTTTIVRQLKKLLSEIEKEQTVHRPVAAYQVQNNKLQYRRLISGIRLMYMRAMHPDEELWRIASRAKISHSHGRIDFRSPKKDANNANSRRMLTIMASRLLHDAAIISENAATGIFPSLQPIETGPVDAHKLFARLKTTLMWEKKRKAEYKTQDKSAPPKAS